MTTKLLINDTADVIFKRKSDGHIVFTTEAQLASISSAVSEEQLRGGIGNKTVAVTRTEKTVDLSVRSALWDAEFLAMSQGVAIQEDGSAKVKKILTATVADNAGTLEATIQGTTTAVEGVFFDTDGSQAEVTITTNKFAVPTGSSAVAGDTVTVVVEQTVTGDIISIDSQKFSEKYEVEYRTIAYDPKTMKVVQDVYIQFDEAIPSGNVEMSLENGTPLTPEMNFMVTTPAGKTEMGRIIRVDRAA